MAIGTAIGIPFKKSGQSWSSYWTSKKVLDYTSRSGLDLLETGSGQNLNGVIIPSCGVFNGSDDQLALSGGVISYTDSIEIEFKAKCTATISSNVLLSMLYAGGSDYICLRSATTMRVNVGGTLLAFARPTNDKLWHIYKVRFIQGATTTVRVWIDGTESTTGTLDVGSVKPFKLQWLSGTGSYGFPGNISYVKITNTGTSVVLNHWILTGHGLYEYDIVGDTTFTWAGTGIHYTFDADSSTYLLDSGWTEWRKDGVVVEYVPTGGDTAVITTAGYLAKRIYAGSANGYNKAPSLVGFNPTGSDNALLTHFDRSNETIQSAVSRASAYYLATSLITKSQYHCSELEYDGLTAIFNTGYKNWFFAKNNIIGVSTLIEGFTLYSQDATGGGLTYLKTLTKSQTVQYPEYNYYVSSLGNDSNDGLTTASSWLTIDRVNDSNLVPNTNINLNKGDRWRETIVISKDGVSSYPITFKSYGTGDKPIISGADIVSSFADQGDNIWDATLAVLPNVVIIGGTKGTYKTSKVACTSVGDWYSDGSTLSVNYISDPSGITQASTRFNCVNGGGDYNAFENIKFEANKTLGIYMTGANIDISYCDFENIGGRNANCCGINVQNNNMSITYCTFTDIEYTGVNGVSGNSVVVSHNIFNNCWNGVQYPDGGNGAGIITAGESWEVSYNTITDCYRGIGVVAAGELIHHNIIVNAKTNGIDHSSGSTELLPSLIYNNTIIHSPGNTSGHGLVTQGDDANYVKFKNNLVYVTFTGTNSNVQGMCIMKDTYLGIDTDYNLVYKTNDSTADIWILLATYNTLVEWKAALSATSFEGKGVHDLSADPLFTDFAGGNYTLQAGSPAKNAGVDVGYGVSPNIGAL